MGVTINVNGLSLVHKGSGGVAMATVPDVCKTPSPGGPVPVPYPNIARSASLAKGSTTVKVDGGNSAANKGSEFSTSSGDEAGTLGGVKSGVNMKEATWLTYSMDVKIEGKNAARLTDKMLMNHGNTVCLGGALNPVVAVDSFFKIVCPHFCAMLKRIQAGEKLKPGETWTRKLQEQVSKHSDELLKIGVKFEKSAVVGAIKGAAAVWKRKALVKFGKRFGAKLVTKAVPVVGWALAAYDVYDAASLVKQGYDLMRVRPDFVLETTDGNLFGDVKFPQDTWSDGQKDMYTSLNNGTTPPEVNKKNCKC